ncbi:MAG: hypothetical protein ACJAWV_002844 [Flammeovirgaceae bacterium]|jgi:hypothetical protein
MLQKTKTFAISFILLFIHPLTFSQSSQIEMKSENWKFKENTTHRVEKFMGEQSLYVNGLAFLPEVEFSEGVLEVDIAPASHRGFGGLVFRLQDDANYEQVYLRLHKSCQPDAVQYVPHFNGETTWQLYREHQAMVCFQEKQWNHLKLVIEGREMKAYLNGQEKPFMIVNDLKREEAIGSIGLFSLFGAHFANFSFTPKANAISKLPSRKPMDLAKGIIQDWEISKIIQFTESIDVEKYPAELLKKTEWMEGKVEESGLLNLNRLMKRKSAGKFERNKLETVWVRTVINYENAQSKKLFFDFSDQVTVFVNGEPIFSGNNSFLFKGSTFRGDIHIEGNAIYLPLQKGENEVVFAVSEKANGWGIMAKLVD